MTNPPGRPDADLVAQIIAQNVAMHEASAELYTVLHPELRHAFERRLLCQDLDAIAEPLAAVERPLAVDVGAGTGRLTLAFVARGWDCVALDNSPAMLAILQRRYDRLRGPKGALTTVVCGADDYAAERPAERPVHLVGFSSVLHHLPDYVAVVERFARLLTSGGVLYITHEPLPEDGPRRTRKGRIVRRVDQFFGMPQRFWRALVKRKLRARVPAGLPLVDYHDQDGLDMAALRRVLADNGLEIIREVPYKDRKTALMAWLDTRFLHTPGWRFRLVARKRPD